MSYDRTTLIDRISPVEEQVAANVAMSINTKISDAVYWGDGAWDKIHYSIEALASVSLCCRQSEEGIKQAQEVAYDLAWEASREAIGAALKGHVTDIRTRLFPELFDE